MPEPVVLRTPRLVLREYVEGDFAAVHAYAGDPEMTRYMAWGPNTEADTREFLAEALAARGTEPRTVFDLAITLRDGGRLVGGCGLRVSEPRHRGGVIGYILHRDAWGRGYASEAAQALVDFGFGTLGMHRIYAVCDPANVASAHVLEKLGMRREGVMREHRWEKGRWVDELLYAVLDREWAARRASTSRV
jgi:ribosomal-protein-alanine N-acetyltransferase